MKIWAVERQARQSAAVKTDALLIGEPFSQICVTVSNLSMHRSRGPRGFFCLQVVRRVPVIVAVIPLTQMQATFETISDNLLVWFGPQHQTFSVVSIENLPNCSLITGCDNLLLGLKFHADGAELVPQTLMTEIANVNDDKIEIFLESSYDPECDMGYIRLDDRGPASVKYSADCGFVILDIGDDDAVIGVEVFSPTKTCPLLIGQNAG